MLSTFGDVPVICSYMSFAATFHVPSSHMMFSFSLQLAYCVVQFIEKDPSLTEAVCES